MIYTHKEASDIVDIAETVLLQNNIHVPSPEDDEREPDDMAGFYGSVYSDILDKIEEKIISICQRCENGESVIKNIFP